MNAVELSLFANRVAAICDEMGAALRNAAFSPNIRDRLDFSCAVFDASGRLCAQAAHIPVHLGSMAWAMSSIIEQIDWHAGDMIVLNDPFMGGTHLPDVTVIAPVTVDGRCVAFVANRAHHADIGSETPGSMPLAKTLQEEGQIIAPTRIVAKGNIDTGALDAITRVTRNPGQGHGDFTAQISANRTGMERVHALVVALGADQFRQAVAALNDYAATLARSGLAGIPAGRYSFTDYMDDDGFGHTDIAITVQLEVTDGEVSVDFSGTADQVVGNINCPMPVTAAAVYYAFRCLMPAHTPACAGSLQPIRISAPEGSLVHARRPAAVAAGNVETSTRIVDVILGALTRAMPDRIPAASHGSMNNVAMGTESWAYYETIGGGMGAGRFGGGLHGVQTHMTNTLNTPVEVLESNFPLRVTRYSLRRGSGGSGDRPGGDGIVREYEFLAPASVSLLTERRLRAPWGAGKGSDGLRGRNLLNGRPLPGKTTLSVVAGDKLTIETPGGGGYA